jgi:hypothetical protein
MALQIGIVVQMVQGTLDLLEELVLIRHPVSLPNHRLARGPYYSTGGIQGKPDEFYKAWH